MTSNHENKIGRARAQCVVDFNLTERVKSVLGTTFPYYDNHAQRAGLCNAGLEAVPLRTAPLVHLCINESTSALAADTCAHMMWPTELCSVAPMPCNALTLWTKTCVLVFNVQQPPLA